MNRAWQAVFSKVITALAQALLLAVQESGNPR